jgi:prevent-host-death family protein
MTASIERSGVLREVGAFEAKNKPSELLDLAEDGEEIVITRHGKQVAKLVPARHGVDREGARVAALLSTLCLFRPIFRSPRHTSAHPLLLSFAGFDYSWFRAGFRAGTYKLLSKQ